MLSDKVTIDRDRLNPIEVGIDHYHVAATEAANFGTLDLENHDASITVQWGPNWYDFIHLTWREARELAEALTTVEGIARNG